MADIWFYRLIFVLSVILGIVIRAPSLVRLALVKGGIEGLLTDQQISKEKLDFQQQKLLRELDQSTKPATQQQVENVEALNSCRDLTLPGDPDEGY
jgi:hypothetical protein